MRYLVTGRYKSDAGSFAAGDIIELTAEQAAWFNRDVPGLMVPVTEPAVEPTLPDAPPMDRMIKNAPKKRGKGA